MAAVAQRHRLTWNVLEQSAKQDAAARRRSHDISVHSETAAQTVHVEPTTTKNSQQSQQTCRDMLTYTNTTQTTSRVTQTAHAD